MGSLTGKVVAGVLALVAVLAPAAAEPPGGDRFLYVRQVDMFEAPVVFVVLDELPVVSLMDLEWGIDRSLFPSFAALARTSTWYRNTATTETFTKEALPALLTGSYPIRQLGVSFDYPRNLFSMLGDSYEIRGADVRPGLCPPTACDELIEVAPVRRLRSFGLGEKGSLFFSFLRLLERPDRPRLHFLHLVFPHGPWRYLPTGQRYDEVDPMPGEVEQRGRGTAWARDTWLVEQGYQRHLMQTRLADRLVGALMVKLKRTGLWDEALVVVTADHGVAFEPGRPKRLPRDDTLATLAAVPLFVKAPGQDVGAVSDVPAQTVDVLPTVADVLDASLWPEVDGRSLLRHVPRDRAREVVDVPVVSLGRAVRDAVRAKYELLAHDGRTVDLWRIAPGPAGSLIGSEVDGLDVREAGPVTVHTSSLESVAGADPERASFPAFFEGTLDGVAEGHRPLVAVAVNGEVVAVTRAYESHELTWFGAMLRPGAFTDGRDEVELFLVEDVGAGRLVRLPLT